MLVPHVPDQLPLGAETLVAELTHVGLRPRVSVYVVPQVLPGLEPLVANLENMPRDRIR